MGMRAVLEFLRRNGPATVPTIARSRGVSRQHIQALVNLLLGQHLAEAADNPAHRRSLLVQLTAKGAQTIDRMRRREAAVLGETEIALERGVATDGGDAALSRRAIDA